MVVRWSGRAPALLWQTARQEHGARHHRAARAHRGPGEANGLGGDPGRWRPRRDLHAAHRDSRFLQSDSELPLRAIPALSRRQADRIPRADRQLRCRRADARPSDHTDGGPHRAPRERHRDLITAQSIWCRASTWRTASTSFASGAANCASACFFRYSSRSLVAVSVAPRIRSLIWTSLLVFSSGPWMTAQGEPRLSAYLSCWPTACFGLPR